MRPELISQIYVVASLRTTLTSGREKYFYQSTNTDWSRARTYSRKNLSEEPKTSLYFDERKKCSSYLSEADYVLQQSNSNDKRTRLIRKQKPFLVWVESDFCFRCRNRNIWKGLNAIFEQVAFYLQLPITCIVETITIWRILFRTMTTTLVTHFLNRLEQKLKNETTKKKREENVSVSVSKLCARMILSFQSLCSIFSPYSLFQSRKAPLGYMLESFQKLSMVWKLEWAFNFDISISDKFLSNLFMICFCSLYFRYFVL